MAGISNSIVVVSFNSKAAVLALLKSLHIEEATSSEVILVDSGSFDGTREVISEQYPMVKIVPLKTNRGYFAAANKGMDQAEGDIVTLCHADVIADVHTLAELADQAREAEGRKVAAVIPRLLSVDGSPQGNVGNFPTLGSSIAGVFSPPAGLKCHVPALDHVAPHEWRDSSALQSIITAWPPPACSTKNSFSTAVIQICAPGFMPSNIESSSAKVFPSCMPVRVSIRQSHRT